MLESSDELRTHALKEYKLYLVNLQDVIIEGSESYLTENWNIFKKAKESMKAPSSIDEDDYPFFSGGSSCIPDYESPEQAEAAKKVREFMDSQLQQNGLSVKGIDILDRDKQAISSQPVNFNEAYNRLLAEQPLTTEAALQFIGGIQTFEEAQDSFFKGFLTADEESSLDKFFTVTSYDDFLKN